MQKIKQKSQNNPIRAVSSTHSKQQPLVHKSKQCGNCKRLIASDKYQGHIKLCVPNNSKQNTIQQTGNNFRQSGYSTKNSNNMGKIFMKKDNNSVMLDKMNKNGNYNTFNSKNNQSVRGRERSGTFNKNTENSNDIMLRRKVSANYNTTKPKISQVTNKKYQEMAPLQQIKHQQDQSEIKIFDVHENIQKIQQKESKFISETEERFYNKIEDPQDSLKDLNAVNSDNQQIQNNVQSQVNTELKKQQKNDNPQEEDNQNKKTRSNIRIRPGSARNKKVSNQVRLTEIQNQLIRKYNDSPERIRKNSKVVVQEIEYEDNSEEKTNWEKERERRVRREKIIQRQRQRERERQKILQRQRQITRQRAEEEAIQRQEQQQRIRRQQREQRSQFRRARQQNTFLQTNLNINPVYNQTLYNLFQLISVANELICYVENYTQEDPVLIDMLQQIRNLNQLAAQVSQLITDYTSPALTMVNTYALRAQQIQQIIFSQIQIILISNLSQFNDQGLIQEVKNTIQTGIANIRSLQFEILPIHSLSTHTKFTSKQIEDTFPPKLATQTYECSICLDQIRRGSKIKQLQCKHLFHPSCIDQWLMQSKKCPMCRQEQALEQ